MKVYSKLKYSDKKLAINSIQKIITESDDNTIIWPGHANEALLKDIDKNLIKI